MSALSDRIHELQSAAVDIAQIPDPALRLQGGLWLDNELKKLHETHLFTEDERIEFMAVVKILIDVILVDREPLAPM